MSYHLPQNSIPRQSRASSVHSARPNPYNQIVRFGADYEAGSEYSDGPESYFGDRPYSASHHTNSHPSPAPQRDYIPSSQPYRRSTGTIYSTEAPRKTSHSTHTRSVQTVHISTRSGGASTFTSSRLISTETWNGKPQTTGYEWTTSSKNPRHPAKHSQRSSQQAANPQHDGRARYAPEVARPRAPSQHYWEPPKEQSRPLRPSPFVHSYPRTDRTAVLFPPQQAAHYAQSTSGSKGYANDYQAASRSAATGLAYRAPVPPPLYQKKQNPISEPGYTGDGDGEKDNIPEPTVVPEDSISCVGWRAGEHEASYHSSPRRWHAQRQSGRPRKLYD